MDSIEINIALYRGSHRMTEQKKKELKKAPKNKAKKSMKIFNKMAKNITFPH